MTGMKKVLAFLISSLFCFNISDSFAVREITEDMVKASDNRVEYTNMIKSEEGLLKVKDVLIGNGVCVYKNMENSAEIEVVFAHMLGTVASLQDVDGNKQYFFGASGKNNSFETVKYLGDEEKYGDFKNSLYIKPKGKNWQRCDMENEEGLVFVSLEDKESKKLDSYKSSMVDYGVNIYVSRDGKEYKRLNTTIKEIKQLSEDEGSKSYLEIITAEIHQKISYMKVEVSEIKTFDDPLTRIYEIKVRSTISEAEDTVNEDSGAGRNLGESPESDKAHEEDDAKPKKKDTRDRVVRVRFGESEFEEETDAWPRARKQRVRKIRLGDSGERDIIEEVVYKNGRAPYYRKKNIYHDLFDYIDDRELVDRISREIAKRKNTANNAVKYDKADRHSGKNDNSNDGSKPRKENFGDDVYSEPHSKKKGRKKEVDLDHEDFVYDDIFAQAQEVSDGEELHNKKQKTRKHKSRKKANSADSEERKEVAEFLEEDVSAIDFSEEDLEYSSQDQVDQGEFDQGSTDQDRFEDQSEKAEKTISKVYLSSLALMLGAVLTYDKISFLKNILRF